MITYKGTDKNMRCHGGFQYEVGKEYVCDGAIRCGSKGFHSCVAPLDVLKYYHPKDGSRFFVCEADGKMIVGTGDSKVASSRLVLKTEINIPALVKAHIEFVKSNTTTECTGKKTAAAGDGGAATAGYCGAAIAGDGGAATAGNGGAAIAGDRGAATAGYCGAAIAGDGGAATAGSCGAATSRGSVSVGKNGAGLVRGNSIMIRGGLGAILTIAEEYDDNCEIKCWKSVIVDGKKIRADVLYKLVDGKFVEAESVE